MLGKINTNSTLDKPTNIYFSHEHDSVTEEIIHAKFEQGDLNSKE